MGKATVEVPRRTFVLLVGALVIALAGVAFFIGRESAERTPADTSAPSGQSPAGPSGVSAAPSAERRSPEPRPAVPLTDSRPGGSIPAETGPSLVPAQPAAPPLAQPQNPERDAVARYFQEIDALQAGGAFSSDPQTFAMTLIGQSAQGDWRSFDAMARDQRLLVERAGRVTVPSACQSYHTRSLALMRESMALLESIKSGMQAGNTSALTTLSARAQKLQTEAADLQALGESIKRQYGIQ